MHTLNIPAALLLGCGLVACSGDDDTGELPTRTVEFSQAIVSLFVNSSEGDVTLVGSDTRIVTVSFPWDGEYEPVQFDNQASGRLSIGSVCEDGTLGCGVDLTIELPSGTDFDITTELGNIDLQGMGVTGTVSTTNGSITASGLGQMQLTAETLGGDVDVAFGLVPVEVFLGGGALGNVELDLPRGAAGRYDFDVTTSGSVTYTGGLENSTAGPPITVVTGSGDVVINGI